MRLLHFIRRLVFRDGDQRARASRSEFDAWIWDFGRFRDVVPIADPVADDYGEWRRVGDGTRAFTNLRIEINRTGGAYQVRVYVDAVLVAIWPRREKR